MRRETMLERVQNRFALEPDRIAAVAAYGTAEMPGWLVEREIDPPIPVRDRSDVGADGTFARADFRYDRERDLHIRRGGKEQKTSGTVFDGTTLEYIAERSDCGRSPLEPDCTTGRERGLGGARDEFLLAATVQNPKRLMRHAGPAPPMPMVA